MSRFLSPSNPIPSSGPYTEILLRSLIRNPTGRSTRLFFSYSCKNSHSLAIALKHISCSLLLLPSPTSSRPGRCLISFGYTRSCPRRLSPAGAWSEPSSQLRGGAGPGGMRRPEASKRGRVRARGLGGADSGWASRRRICGGRVGVVIVAGGGVFVGKADLRREDMRSFTVGAASCSAK